MKKRWSIAYPLLIQTVVLLWLLISAATPVVAFVQAPATLLDRILARGYILVGTCGDYKPFTYFDPETKEFSGIDIDMANELGKALGVETRFVKTTWLCRKTLQFFAMALMAFPKV